MRTVGWDDLAPTSIGYCMYCTTYVPLAFCLSLVEVIQAREVRDTEYRETSVHFAAKQRAILYRLFIVRTSTVNNDQRFR